MSDFKPSRSTSSRVDEGAIQPWLLDHLPPGDQPYPGTPLDRDNREIRVLLLAGGDFYSPLRGELQTISLAPAASQTAYDALSYTWGVRSKAESILICDCYIPITDNLSNALRRLRHPRDSRRLWIDAICIKQTDLDERAQQVRMMGDIYRSANTTLIWLGDLPNHLPREWHEAALLWQDASKDVDLTGMNEDGEEAEWLYKKFPAHAIEAAISSTVPYWHDRAWVLQEYVMAKKAILCFGNYTLDASRMEYRQRIRFSSVAIYVDLGKLPISKAFCQRMSNFDFIAQHTRQAGDGIPTLNMYQAGQFAYHLHCMDDRDKIYSLLSITTSKEADMIEVDYRATRTATAVFAEATHASLVAGFGPSTLLTVSTCRQLHDGTPSWVLNFKHSWNDTLAHVLQAVRFCQPPHWIQDIPPSNIYALDRGTLSLTLTGVPIDSVHQSTVLAMNRPFQADPWPYRDLHLDGVRSARHLLETAGMYSISQPGQFKSMYGDFRWAPELLHNDGQGFLGYDLASDVDTALHELILAWQSRAGIRDDIPSKVTGNLQLLKTMCVYAGFTDEAIAAFTTTAGLFGIAPGVMEAGDLIVTLPFHKSEANASAFSRGLDVGQCNVPMVLRPSGGKYRFRGFAFVYGLFRGELKAQWPDDTIPVRQYEVI
jgi:hypothetical protein